jgi:hypothetical protein
MWSFENYTIALAIIVGVAVGIRMYLDVKGQQ